MHLWIGKDKIVATHDSGSPLSFHNEEFRNQVDPAKVKFLGRRTIRVRGFFDTEHGPPPKPQIVKLYSFKMRLVEKGTEYEVISHELHRHQSNCQTMLVGRGSMAENGWAWRQDENKASYVGTDKERSYTFDSTRPSNSQMDTEEEVFRGDMDKTKQSCPGGSRWISHEMVNRVAHILDDDLLKEMREEAHKGDYLRHWARLYEEAEKFEEEMKSVLRDLNCNEEYLINILNKGKR